MFPDFFVRGSSFSFLSSLFFTFLLLSLTAASYAAEKSYLRLEENEPSELNDYVIKSIGGFVFENDMAAHIDLTKLQSEVVGDSYALDFGAGYVFNWDISVFLGLGLSLDYNLDTDKFSDKYYSEIGMVIDLSKKLSITARKQKYFNQPEIYEEVIMVGVLFRD